MRLRVPVSGVLAASVPASGGDLAAAALPPAPIGAFRRPSFAPGYSAGGRDGLERLYAVSLFGRVYGLG